MPNAAFFVFSAAYLLAGDLPLPGTSSVTVGLAAPSGCVECHGNFDAKSAYETWVGSAMGHAARDPVFLSALTEAEKDAPGKGDFCLRCHATEAWLQGRCAETDGSLLTDEDSGVTCSVCHRMDPSPWLRNGQFLLGNDLDYRGPYEKSAAPHHYQKGELISKSELCATCHDLYNPLVERRTLDGAPTGMLFPEQTTYTEWATSYFAGPEGKTCQDCHMPEETGQVAVEGPVRMDRSSHELTGGNVFLLSAIAFLEPGLGISDRLQAGVARTQAMLRSAATLEAIDPPASVRRGEAITVMLRVTNETGHKLPTGYPIGRRVWMQLRAPELGIDRGAFDEERGDPQDPFVIYETLHGQGAIGAPGFRVALNDTIYSDTRIPPRAMVSTATTAPVGRTFPETAPGVYAGYDDVPIAFTVPCDPGLSAISIDATLWYQAVTKSYVEALVSANGAIERGVRLAAAFEEVDPGPIEMEGLALSLTVDPASSCDPPDAGIADVGGEIDSGAVPLPPDAGPNDSGNLADGGSSATDTGCGCRSTNPGFGDGVFALLLIAVCIAWSRRSSR